MKIGLDCDGVVFDFVTTMHNLIPSIPLNPTSVDVFKYLKNQAEIRTFNNLISNPDMYASLKVFSGFEDIIPELNQHEIYIISSRPKVTQEATEDAVLKAGIEPVEFIFTGKKGKACEDNNIDIMIDDQVKYAKQVVAPTIVIMPVRSYNKEYIDSKISPVIPYHTPAELAHIIDIIDKDRRRHAS